MKETTAVRWSRLYTSKRRTLPTGLMSSQCCDLHVNQSVLSVQANMLNVLSKSSHQLTLTEQTWPGGCWHYCKPTAPPKHAFSFGAIPYTVCKATIAVSISSQRRADKTHHPLNVDVTKWARMCFGLPVCLCLISVDVVPQRLCEAVRHQCTLSCGKKGGVFGSGSELSVKVRTAESNL